MNYLDRPKLVRLTNEIHFFNEQGIKVSIEVGKRLSEAKNEFPTSEEWISWTESEFGYKKSQTYKLVSIANKFHSSGNLFEGKTINEVYALTAFDEEELNQPVQLPSGETKAPIDMTNKEIEEYKRQAKDAEQRAKQAEQEKIHWQGVAKSAQNRPPQVITKTIEKVPVTVESELADLRFKAKQYEAGYKEAKAKLAQYELRDTVSFDEEQSELQRKKMQHEADMNTIQLSIIFKTFIEKAAITPYLIGALATSNPFEKKRLQDQIEIAERIIREAKTALTGRNLGGVVNE